MFNIIKKIINYFVGEKIENFIEVEKYFEKYYDQIIYDDKELNEYFNKLYNSFYNDKEIFHKLKFEKEIYEGGYYIEYSINSFMQLSPSRKVLIYIIFKDFLKKHYKHYLENNKKFDVDNIDVMIVGSFTSKYGWSAKEYQLANKKFIGDIKEIDLLRLIISLEQIIVEKEDYENIEHWDKIFVKII